MHEFNQWMSIFTYWPLINIQKSSLQHEVTAKHCEFHKIQSRDRWMSRCTYHAIQVPSKARWSKVYTFGFTYIRIWYTSLFRSLQFCFTFNVKIQSRDRWMSRCTYHAIQVPSKARWSKVYTFGFTYIRIWYTSLFRNLQFCFTFNVKFEAFGYQELPKGSVLLLRRELFYTERLARRKSNELMLD